MNNFTISNIEKQVLDGKPLSPKQARFLVGLENDHLLDLFRLTSRVREKLFGNKVRCCSIVAAKVGGCNQDCAFCSQSSRYKTHVKNTTTLEQDDLYQAVLNTASNGAESVGIVTSGHRPSDSQIEHWSHVIQRIRSIGSVRVCASMGIVDRDQARRLARIGVQRYNLNLQTSRAFYPQIVSTHQYDDRLRSIQYLKAAGISICCGALFGMGETWTDRIDLALELRNLDVDTVPINFLIPINGTPLADIQPLESLECLKIIALYRLMLPRQQIKIAGGREANLRDLQSWIFAAGADSFLIGNYLTTCGRNPESDRQMVRDLGLVLEPYRQADHINDNALDSTLSLQNAY
ncbi:MAG: biotin synthase BioB [Planctomycetota bacterium]|nr:MAG: biotin synthase BioB [Planctomycetota bacterium]